MSMVDHLSVGVADYNYTLEIQAQGSMSTSGDKKQIVHEFDDGSVSVATLSDDSYFIVEFPFEVLTEAEAEIILDLWHDVNKANGRARTFYWENSKDYNVYIVRFMGALTKTDQHRLGEYTSIDSVQLRIEGYKEHYAS